MSDGGAASAFFQAVVKVGAPALDCRSGSRHQRGSDAEQHRESQRLEIEMYVERGRAVFMGRQKIFQRTAQPRSCCHAHKRAEGGKHEALAEYLSDQASVSGAQRQAQAEVLSPR